MRSVHGTRAILVGLLACALVATTIITSAVGRFHATQEQRRSAEDFSLPCVVLTLNESNIDPSAKKCTPFVAPPFTNAELDFVAPAAREKILHPHLLSLASDLSNNASVNIYMNHARIWRLVVAHWDVALVLEEDIVVLPHSAEVIAEVLAALRRDNVTNYVVKLIDHFYMHSSDWKLVYELQNHRVLTCSCRPSVYSSCSAAYLIDKAAAQTLLAHAFPASLHVDVFKHHMGCIDNKIKLYQLNPHIMLMNNRPSTHLVHDVHRRFLLVKEVLFNLLHSTC